jgi:hypothetical protein
MKHHTFKVTCGFAMQYTFDETEIGPDGEPTEDAVIALEEELHEHLHQNYAVDFVDAEPDFVIGIYDDDAEAPSTSADH